MNVLTPERPALRILIRDNERRAYLRSGLLASCIKPSDRSASNHLLSPLGFGLVLSRELTARSADRIPCGDHSVTWASPFASRLATTTGRIEFVILRTSRSPPVALHPLSRGRSYVRLRGSNPTSTGTLTLPIQYTHKRTNGRPVGGCLCGRSQRWERGILERFAAGGWHDLEPGGGVLQLADDRKCPQRLLLDFRRRRHSERVEPRCLCGPLRHDVFPPDRERVVQGGVLQRQREPYYQYATGSNSVPTAVDSGTVAGTAVFYGNGESPTAPADVVQAGDLSPYGAMGMDGNVFQWNETLITGSNRGTRGGSFRSFSSLLASSYRGSEAPTLPNEQLGFRVASSEAVPEPGSITLVVSGGLCLLAYVWRGRIGCRAARLSLVLLTSLLSGQPVLYRGVVVVIANCRRLLCVVALFIIGSWFAARGDAGLVQFDGPTR